MYCYSHIAWSKFFSNRWGTTWIIWPVAGVFFVGVYSITDAAVKSKKE